MSLQSLPSRNFSDSDPITPWEPKNRAGRKAYVLVYILISMFPNFHIFWSMGTILVRDIKILPLWLTNPPIYHVYTHIQLYTYLAGCPQWQRAACKQLCFASVVILCRSRGWITCDDLLCLAKYPISITRPPFWFSLERASETEYTNSIGTCHCLAFDE